MNEVERERGYYEGLRDGVWSQVCSNRRVSTDAFEILMKLAPKHEGKTRLRIIRID